MKMGLISYHCILPDLADDAILASVCVPVKARYRSLPIVNPQIICTAPSSPDVVRVTGESRHGKRRAAD